MSEIGEAIAAEDPPPRTSGGWLDRIERLGNVLPDPVAIFVIMIVALMTLSAIGASLGWQATNPVTGELLAAKSLLAETMVRQILTEFPRTFAAFPPLGMVLAMVMAAGVADHSGLLNTLVRASLQRVPLAILTPTVFLVGMLSTHAVDAAGVVYVPLAGVVYAAIGRHPVLGVVTAFAGVGTGLSGNLLPGQFDVMLLSITQVGARLVDPTWQMNPLGNWYFGIAIALAFTAAATLVLDRIVAPRIGPWRRDPGAADEMQSQAITPLERRGLHAAGLGLLGLVGLVAALMLWPGYTPLWDAAAPPGDRIKPFFGALVVIVFLLFLVSGWAFGAATGSIRSHRDVVTMMQKGILPLLTYLVIVLFAAQFVAMFGWSNLGPIAAIVGAEQLRALGAPPAVLLPLLATLTAWLDFLIASGSAKWTVMAPVAAPMFMLLGISPEMTTAAYRIGDTVTNLISPLNAGLVLTLTFCQRWIPSMRLGSFIALTLPVAIALYVTGIVVTVLWVSLALPVGPGAGVVYHLP
jgi:aminobenzoyl-glutamate transport protein